MNLIEQLANRWYDNYDGDFYGDPIVGYQAGFRQARQMAYELMAKGDPKCFGLDVEIENMGEEVVDL